jgi:hypothetical protein
MNARRIRLSLLAGALLALPSLALAATPHTQETPTTGMKPVPGQAMQKKDRMRIHRTIKGRHFMPATVESVDHGTGIVKLESLGMGLVVHFPPPTIKDLKAGDKISLLLGYRMNER